MRDILRKNDEGCRKVAYYRINAERLLQRIIGFEYVFQPVLILFDIS